MLQVIVTVTRVFPPTHPLFSELFQMMPWPRNSSLLRPLLHLIFLKNNLCWMSVTLSTPTFITWNKHRYCRCRPLFVTFVYCEFSTLSCATKLEKVPHFCTKYSKLTVFTSYLPWWHKSFNQLAPFFELFFSVALKEQFHWIENEWNRFSFFFSFARGIKRC